MKIKVNAELIGICDEIFALAWPIEEWVKRESSDMFQTKNYNGGFDADEMEFCFSYYDENEKEFWFQMTMKDIDSIRSGELTEISVRPAE